MSEGGRWQGGGLAVNQQNHSIFSNINLIFYTELGNHFAGQNWPRLGSLKTWHIFSNSGTETEIDVGDTSQNVHIIYLMKIVPSYIVVGETCIWYERYERPGRLNGKCWQRPTSVVRPSLWAGTTIRNKYLSISDWDKSGPIWKLPDQGRHIKIYFEILYFLTFLIKQSDCVTVTKSVCLVWLRPRSRAGGGGNIDRIFDCVTSR